ncbi:MAG: hypothetical protein LBC65_06200 [Oscillospiraceae bacterium]|jgi:penicillin-binding protein 2|nr:hypothetical protein [Oscillospiraceae bacterium]
MKQHILSPGRAAVLYVIPIVALAIFIVQLYNLQVVHGSEYLQHSRSNIVTVETIPAARGSIYDRYGRLLVGNRVSYSLAINREKLVESGDPNGWLLKMIELAIDMGIEYNDTLPMSKYAPYDLLPREEMTDEQYSRLMRYLGSRRLKEETTGRELLDWLRVHYSVPKEFTDDEARLTVGVRYELELRSLFAYSAYYFVDDVTAELLVILQEQQFPAITRVPISAPVYYTKYAAHLLGVVGAMTPSEVDHYLEQGYSMDARVGRFGLEAAFESELHGFDGSRTITRSPSGAITDILYSQAEDPGHNIRTTLDIELQQVAEQYLESTINSLNQERIAKAVEKGYSADSVQTSNGGAVVVMDVRNGDLLAAASYPSFDITTYSKNAAALNADPSAPLYNRAIQGLYEPGSTFKIVTAIAALQEKVISDGTVITDEGKYTKYESDGYAPTCALYPYGTHGDLTVVDAITHSCNYFFYVVGNNLTIDNIAQYASYFGLGSKTGIELTYESIGNVASPEYKLNRWKQPWMPGDTLQAAIGQSFNLFTPVQLAQYCATIANSGTRYSAHFLKEIKSHDNSVIVTEYEPNVLNKVPADEYYFTVVQTGMRGVASTGTASSVFAGYPFPVAAKTGTVQFGDDLENNALFMAYAPADDPKIAVAVVVEKGGAGAQVAVIAKGVFDYYFASTYANRGLPDDGVLLK